MKNIGLEKIIDELELSSEDKQIIKALIIGKLVHPASENETHRWLRNNSGLGEILKINFNEVGKDRIYRAGDKILKNKDIIEEALNKSENWKQKKML
ncbi:MAG TPA: hypothetical protein PKY81_06085 [bacterium]|nr:hypothetical protein [bacterium]